MPNRFERVVWSEGMLMRPQHLQQQEHYLESVMAAKVAALTPHDWGIVAMKLESGDLARGVVTLRDFRGVLPSGMPLLLEGSASSPSRPFHDRLTGTKTLLEVFLGVPLRQEHAPAFNLGTTPEMLTRYKTVERSVRDLTGEGREESITAAYPNAVLLFGDEPRSDYETIKIAEIVRDEAGNFVPSPSYIPPVLKLAAAPVLRDRLQEILSIMVAKHRHIAQSRRHVDAAAVEWSASDITRFLVLHALGAGIPAVRHLVEEPELSPLAAYLALAQIAGSLTSFCTDVDPSTFAPFDHGDLRTTFTDLFGHLQRMLGTTVRESAVSVSLEARKDGMWIGKLAERHGDCAQFVLAVETGHSATEVLRSLPSLAKIGSWKQIGQIVRAATPGVTLRPLHRPPSEIPLRPNHIYFGLEEDPHLHAITRERTIAIYLPPPYDPSSARVLLFGVARSGTEA